MTQPQTLGLRKSFGFGDRLGLATPGHLAALRSAGDFAPIFAQQSIREMTRTQRTPEEVMTAARSALNQCGYAGPWGADGDHLKTADDVRRVAAAGFCFFTIDPSAHVDNRADHLRGQELAAAADLLDRDHVFGAFEWRRAYTERSFEVAPGRILRLTPETLARAAVKYGRAVAHAESMGQAIQAASAGRAFEIEVSVDETDSPTTPEEHLFFGLELRRRRVPGVVSLAPRFVGDFEKGIDYRGDIAAFESQLRAHVDVARFCGPYKISIHSGSDKFGIYPSIGRICGTLLHVKTAGTSYLEALRVVARTEPSLFADIATFARGRFEADRASYHISTTLADIERLPVFRSAADEPAYLDAVAGRQLLHVTFGSVLTLGADARGRRFKEGLLGVLQRRPELHLECLQRHLGHHLTLLNAG